MLKKLIIVMVCLTLLPLSGCSPFKSVRNVGNQQISSFDTLIIRDFSTEDTLIDEGFNVPGIIIGAIRKQKEFKPFYNPARKRELTRLLTNRIYDEVKSRRIFSNVYKNARGNGNTLFLDGRFTKVNVNSYHGNAPSYVSIEISGIMSAGGRNQEIVFFEDEEDGRITDVVREFAIHIADYLEKKHSK